jgi:hypothetical protein
VALLALIALPACHDPTRPEDLDVQLNVPQDSLRVAVGQTAFLNAWASGVIDKRVACSASSVAFTVTTVTDGCNVTGVQVGSGTVTIEAVAKSIVRRNIPVTVTAPGAPTL